MLHAPSPSFLLQPSTRRYQQRKLHLWPSTPAPTSRPSAKSSGGNNHRDLPPGALIALSQSHPWIWCRRVGNPEALFLFQFQTKLRSCVHYCASLQSGELVNRHCAKVLCFPVQSFLQQNLPELTACL